MFAAVFIPDFPVEAIVRLRTELRDRPVAVLEGTPPLLRVMAVNDRAADLGLECGMTKLQAEAIATASNAVLAMRSVEQEASAQAALLDVACAFSPRVENTAPGLVVLDVAGLDRIFGPPAKIARDLARRCSDIGLEAQVATASNPDAAAHAARGFSGVTVIPEGREAERLATLPIDVLPTIDNQKSKSKKDGGDPADLLNILESWGVRNLRALAALPEVAVSERLGQAGLHWQRLARGATARALRLIDPPARFEESCELDYPLDSLEPLSFLLNRMLDQLCTRLSSRALATSELRLALALDTIEGVKSSNDISDFRFPVSDSESALLRTGNQKSEIENQKCFCRSLRLPVPMLDPKVLLKLLQLDLQSHPPGAPVTRISLEAIPAEPRRTQNGLFDASAPDPERLEVTLARMDRVIGAGPTSTRAGAAELVDTHRPDSFRMHRFTTPDRNAGVSPAMRVLSDRNAGVSPATRTPSDRNAGVSPATLNSTASQSRRDISLVAQDAVLGTRPSVTPESRRDGPTTALRLYRPPLAARVVVRNGAPAKIECAEFSGDISWAAGPWKSSGDWWTDRPWSREEWDISTKDACFRIYRDPTGWFVEGTYD